MGSLVSRRTPRCVVIGSDGDVARLQGDGLIGEGDAEALLDFLAFLRGEITAAEFDERSNDATRH